MQGKRGPRRAPRSRRGLRHCDDFPSDLLELRDSLQTSNGAQRARRAAEDKGSAGLPQYADLVALPSAPRGPPAPAELAPQAALPGGGWEEGWGRGAPGRRRGQQGARGALPRESEGRAAGLGTLPPSAAFSHISAGRGRVSHALPLRPPPPPLAPRSGAARAAELTGLAARRPAALLPATARCTGEGEGREEGAAGSEGSEGPSSAEGSALPPSCQKAKTERRTEEPSPLALALASPRRPRMRGARTSGFL